MITCPACGQPVAAPRVPIEALVSAPFSHVRRTIVRKLSDRYPAGVPADDLLIAIYSGSREPESARGALSVQIATLRRILPAYGWTIPQATGGRGNTAIYRLEPLS